MPAIWEAPQEIRTLVHQLRSEHHPHLALAGFWVLVSDANPIRDNRIVTTQTRRCTRTEKLSTGHDFKIIILARTWQELTDGQRSTAIDEALCRCGVRFIPQTVEINGKKEVVKDDLGRTIFTDEIAFDNEGQPKWKINHPDAALFFPMLQRHRAYSEEAGNVLRALDGKPLKLPIAADRADDLVEELAM